MKGSSRKGEKIEAPGKDTVHGRLNFLQLVGLTAGEVDMLMKDHAKAQKLAEHLQKDYPHLETDMGRTKDYIF